MQRVCKRTTTQFCWKCRRYFCNKAPLKGMSRDGKKYPKTFSVKVPLLEGDKSLNQDSNGKPIFKTECGVLSCCIIGYQEKQKEMYGEKKTETLAASRETSEGAGVIVERGEKS